MLHSVKALILQISIPILSMYTSAYCDVFMCKVGYMSTTCKTSADCRHRLFMLLFLCQQYPGTYNWYNIQSCSCSCNVMVFEAAFHIVSMSNLQALLYVPLPEGPFSRSQMCNAMWLSREWDSSVKAVPQHDCVNTAEVPLYFLMRSVN